MRKFNRTIAIGIYTAPLSSDVTHQRVNSAAIYEAIAVVTNIRQSRVNRISATAV